MPRMKIDHAMLDDVHRYIYGYILVNKWVSPSISEIERALGLRSSRTVWQRMNKLCSLGKIRTGKLMARCIDIIEKPSIPTAPDGSPLYYVRLERAKYAR